MLVLCHATECGRPARAAVLADDMAVATAHDSLGIRVQSYTELHANCWGSQHLTRQTAAFWEVAACIGVGRRRQGTFGL
jgi:hypothetical protein